ncbi:MAG: hypothetical protein OJF49_000075 [Ktedonobacterales bacterium]|nr:MAG: hypothetical protein OJF49_000075 [Ktedonobacterales bacterium]
MMRFVWIVGLVTLHREPFYQVATPAACYEPRGRENSSNEQKPILHIISSHDVM